MLNEKEAMSQPAKAAPTPTNCKAIVRGRTFNHRDGTSELKKFEEGLAMPAPQSPTPKTNCKYCSCDLLDHNFDGFKVLVSVGIGVVLLYNPFAKCVVFFHSRWHGL